MVKPAEKLDKLEALYRINESVLSILDIDKLLDRVLFIIEETFGFSSCAILFYEESTEELYIRAARGYSPEIIKRFRTTVGGRGVTGHVAASREPQFIPNIEEDERYVSGVMGARSEIAIPLLDDEHLIGVLDIESREKHGFTANDFDTLVVFASQVALAIGNARRLEGERRQDSRLAILDEIRDRISASLDLDRLLQVVADSVIEFLNYHQVLIFLRDDTADELRLMAAAGHAEISSDGPSAERVSGSIVLSSFKDNQIQVVRDLEASPLSCFLLDDTGAEAGVPLRIQGQPVGVMYVASLSHTSFDEKDVRFLERICDQLTVIMKDAFVFAGISKQSKQEEVVRKISRVAIQSFDMHRFIDEIVRLVQQSFGFYSVAVFTYEPVAELLELIACAGAELGNLGLGDKLPVSNGIIGLAARSCETQLCNDVAGDPRYRDVLLNTKSELAVPLVHEERVLGVLNIESSRLNQFDDSDVELFSGIAEQMAYTMANAELYRQKTTAHNLLLDLNELSRQINSAFDLGSTITTVVRELPSAVRCRLCSIFFYNEAQQELVLMGHNLPTVDSPEPISLAASTNVLMGRVIELKRSVHVKDIEQELNIPNRPQYKTKSFINILLRHGERIIGVLNLTDKLDRTYFSTDEFYLINSFAEHVVNAIVNAERYNAILQLSVTDGLTGLAVHRHFQESLAQEIARADRHDLPLSLIMLDIDDFRQFNQRHGHQVGDIVLRELALVVNGEIREYDLAARYGGEELGIILPSTSLYQARSMAERLRRAVAEQAIATSHQKLRITISLGVAEYLSGTSQEELIRQVESALGAAKQAGKNCVAVFDCDEVRVC